MGKIVKINNDELLKPKTLFVGDMTNPITINNINNYKFIDVVTSCNGVYNTTRIYKENYQDFTNLISHHIDANVMIIYCANWKFIDNVFTRDREYYLYMTTAGFREISTTSVAIHIRKIVGYE